MIFWIPKFLTSFVDAPEALASFDDTMKQRGLSENYDLMFYSITKDKTRSEAFLLLKIIL